MNWEQICNEGYRLFWRSLVLGGLFFLVLVTSCTAGNQIVWGQWEREQRAACNAAGWTWTYTLGSSVTMFCMNPR